MGESIFQAAASAQMENRMTKKKIPFVHSGFERREGDFYPTIDRRCVYGLVEHFDFTKSQVVDVCAPDGSGIVDTFKELGYHAVGLEDAFCSVIPNTHHAADSWIVTNPPYVRPLVDAIINAQIERVRAGEVTGFAALLRSGFDHAKSRRAMFESDAYFGQIKLCFRPWWSERKKGDNGPIHNYVWHLWRRGTYSIHVVKYSNGEKPSPLRPTDTSPK
jgi:hypothetical protein